MINRLSDHLTGRNWRPSTDQSSILEECDREHCGGSQAFEPSITPSAGDGGRVIAEPARFFNTPERLARLHAVAARWVGTPFFANGNTCGRGIGSGVSCQKLVSAIYRECGACDIEVPNVPMAHARFAKGGESLVEKFMATRLEFAREWPAEAGDLVGFKLGRVVHHLGICLGSGKFIHAMEHCGTIISNLGDATWSSRLAAVWRLKQ